MFFTCCIFSMFVWFQMVFSVSHKEQKHYTLVQFWAVLLFQMWSFNCWLQQKCHSQLILLLKHFEKLWHGRAPLCWWESAAAAAVSSSHDSLSNETSSIRGISQSRFSFPHYQGRQALCCEEDVCCLKIKNYLKTRGAESFSGLFGVAPPLRPLM